MRILIGLLLVFSSTSCANVSYLMQAGRGQLSLWNRAKPIEEWLAGNSLDENSKSLLKEVTAIKRFGESYGIKSTGNYREFVKLEQDSVVYAVSACEPLAFNVKTWSFPFLGSVPYLGFFKKDAADAFAQNLVAESNGELDVDVRGVPAYSTLGWLPDPLLSSMLYSGDAAVGELAEVVLHESLHSTLYISNQSSFNESLATFVGETLATQYLKETRGEASLQVKSYLRGLERSKVMAQAFSEAAKTLKAIYASPLSREEKLRKKEKILSDLKTAHQLRRNLNNAALAQYLTYTEGTRPFARFFSEKCGSDWRRFLSSLSRIKQESFAVPQQEDLTPLFEVIGETCR
jgi:predicted aminopeptidase